MEDCKDLLLAQGRLETPKQQSKKSAQITYTKSIGRPGEPGSLLPQLALGRCTVVKTALLLSRCNH